MFLQLFTLFDSGPVNQKTPICEFINIKTIRKTLNDAYEV